MMEVICDDCNDDGSVPDYRLIENEVAVIEVMVLPSLRMYE